MGHQGQGLTEYGLAICTIAAVSIVGLLSLSSNLNITLADMVPHYPGQVAYTANLPKLPANTSMQPTTPAQSSNTTAKNNKQAVKQPTGISAAIAPGTTKNSLQVSGANGTIKQLANTLTAEAQRLLVEGSITQSQAQGLVNLANQGYQLADAQKLLEDAIRNNQKEVTYNGKTYPIVQFANLFSIDPPPNTAWNLDPQYSGPLMKPFVVQYGAVVKSGTLNNPDTEKTVSLLSYQIVAIGDALGWSLEELTSETQSTLSLDTLNSKLANTFQIVIGDTSVKFVDASAKTKQNSTGICRAGTGKSDGKVCTQ
ncbi:MAG: hypothetical protein K0Q50_3166 [Vampirovibrio sp.]|nr:hypothetical protein [Vampirovibrio sp.]